MKRFSQTLKVVLALIVAVFANGTLPTMVAAATSIDEPDTSINEVVIPQEEVVESPEEDVNLEPVAPATLPLTEEETATTPLFVAPLAMPFSQTEKMGHGDDDEDKVATPVAPSKNDVCGLKDDTYTIPSNVEGVSYYRDMSHGNDIPLQQGTTYSTYNNTTIKIYAEAKRGYEFKHNVQRQWTLSFTNVTCVIPAYPEEPIKVDMCYGDKDRIELRDTEGVYYTVNGEHPDGWVYYNGEELVVTAHALEGYRLDEETPSSWTYNASSFPNDQCLTITKVGKVAKDTNHDGIIGVGDEVDWTITVTNTSESRCESFYVTLSDENAVIEENGHIMNLEAGKSKVLTATSVLTAQDFQLCKATNTATFSGWRTHNDRDAEPAVYTFMKEGPSDPLATGSATAEYTLTCPTPGSGSGSGVTTVSTPVSTIPAMIPSTGAKSVGNPLVVVLSMVAAYGITFFLQRRREILAN